MEENEMYFLHSILLFPERKIKKKLTNSKKKKKSAVYRDGTTAESTVVNGLLGSEV